MNHTILRVNGFLLPCIHKSTPLIVYEILRSTSVSGYVAAALYTDHMFTCVSVHGVTNMQVSGLNLPALLYSRCCYMSRTVQQAAGGAVWVK